MSAPRATACERRRAARRGATARLAIAAAAAVVAQAVPDAARAAPPLCRASASLAPETALVGEQVLYDLRILRREDVTALEWDRPPGFPSFRAEWLPGRSEDAPVDTDGVRYHVLHERRALFPSHAGVLEIPAVELRCRARVREEALRVPALTIAVEALPEANRPPAFGGVVGEVAVSALVSPPAVALGGSLRLSVVAQGAANLWDALDPLGTGDAWGDFEVFRRTPELARDAGRRLALRRYRIYELVPRREGRLALPPIRVAFFDPGTRRFAEAAAPTLVVDVQPARSAGDAQPPGARREAARSAQPGADASASTAPGGAPAAAASARRRFPIGALALGLAAAAAALLAALAVRSARRAAPSPTWQRAEEALAAAEAARGAGDTSACAAACARALRAALSAHVPEAAALSAEELALRAAPGAQRDAAALLAALDRARFEPAGEPGAPADPASVRACIAALRKS